MSELPQKLWLRRAEVRDYLALSEQMMTKLIRNGVLVPKFFPGQKRAFFERQAVLKVNPEAKVK